MRDCTEKGRHSIKFTWDDINKMRELHKSGEYSTYQIGDMFNTDAGFIGMIVRNKRWYDKNYEHIPRVKPHLRGSDHKCSKLTWDEVREIRKLYKDGYKQIQIADKFSIDQTSVSLIVNNKTWIE